MSLGYGSSLTTNKLSADQVSTLNKTKESGSELTSIFRTIITILEVGAAFIPGLNVIAETSIALGGAVLNEILDYSEGNVSLAGTFINFGSAIIGGGATFKLNQKMVKETIGGANKLLTVQSNMLKAGFRDEVVSAKLIELGLISSAEELKNVNKMANIIKNTKLTAFDRGNRGAYGLVKETYKTIPELEKKAIRHGIKDIRNNFTALKRLNSYIKNEALRKESIRLQKRILRRIGYPIEEINPFLEKINKAGLTPEQKYSATLGFIRNTDILYTKNTNFPVFIKAMQKGRIALNQAYEIPLARQLSRLSKNAFPQAATVSKRTAGTYLQRLIKAIRKPESREFNDMVVQPLQAIMDPNDAGRAGVETAYRILKKQLSKTIKLKRTAETIKKARSIEELFEKSGGLVVDSMWMLGYKIVVENPTGQHLVQVSYGKDTGKIRNVYVFATLKDLVSFELSPGEFYLNKWAFSRGGAKLSISGAFGKGFKRSESKMITGVLSFLPVAALRNILSITSNLVENAYSISQGNYFNTWTSKFKKSLYNVSINRSIRLATKGLGGRLAQRYINKKLGTTIGRELQRLGTNVLAKQVKNLIAGKKLMHSITTTYIVNKSLQGISSNLRRALRRSRGSTSVITNTISVRRKFKQFNRIPNALTPGRKYRGIKLKK